ncbi:SRPBCC family protein [Aeromicrobium sp.]|uniref:SRPBCC family protein n=1 Tax=Aeromicrobium sp. TaxID=1871063 RepID=UPI003C3E4761
MPNQSLIAHSIEIEAPAARVWAIVSDLKRMGEWSPQCVSMKVFGGEVKQGARTLNLNRQGWKRWPTNARVVDFEPDHRLSFRILENRTVWSFELEPTATGTRLTESRHTPRGVAAISNAAVKGLLGGVEEFEQELDAGIRQTLERIKSEAERV